MTERKFVLGEQPEWAGLGACVSKDVHFVESLLKNPTESLIERGYAIIKLSNKLSSYYSDFHSVWEEFSASSIDNKSTYAVQQFEQNTNSPNQYHGFSVVHGLKEQFMLRASGTGSDLLTPGVLPKTKIHFGKTALKLFEYCDQACRASITDVLTYLKIDQRNLDRIVDPVVELDSEVQCNEAKQEVFSNYLPKGFISSSIMDNFHYYNFFVSDEKEKAFLNNHGSHTDSGLLTLVVCTDEPGLEVFDQKTEEWIALESLLQEYVNARGENHREYATIFWGDSSAYLFPGTQKKFVKPCFHRVAQCNRERYSVVFKQRTSVTTTPPRYQEDFLLALKQLKSLDESGIVHPGSIQRHSNAQQSNIVMCGVILAAILFVFAWLWI